MPGYFKRSYGEYDADDSLVGNFKHRTDQKQHSKCRACMDFTSWAKFQKDGVQKRIQSHPLRSDCPLDKDELGRNTWSYLHTMAAYYPEQASAEMQQNMKQFFKLFTQFYPCPSCAQDFGKIIADRPPETCSKEKLSKWLCWAHNCVNRKLGKPEFDCNLVDQRWLSGWTDGTCG